MPAHKLPPDVASTVAHALEEDIGSGDLSAALVPVDLRISAEIVCREPAILCGVAWVDEVFVQLDPSSSVKWQHSDGDALQADEAVCSVTGSARALLSGERTALNFLQVLSATATITRKAMTALRGTEASVLDTRKTLPGLRLAQKYAVRCGGGTNHRIGLFDAVLIKENHIAAVGSLSEAVARAKARSPHVLIEVEVESRAELIEALATDADRIMLDNFSVAQLREAVTLRDRQPGKKKELEASGGIEIAALRPIAEAGIDFVSIGALTKNVEAVDFSMRARASAVD